MANKVETAVRTYLASLKGPGALVDHDRVAALRQQLEQTDDQMQRVQIRQQLLDAQNPATDGPPRRLTPGLEPFSDGP